MAEITNLFKATVKTVKARNKAQGGTPLPVDKSILGIKGQIHRKGDFEIKSKDVVSNITQLRDFLLEHRKEYINAFNHLGRSTTKMTDAERDQIDSEAEKYMRLCSDEIKSLKSREFANKQVAQVQEHKNAVISLLEAYLKMICNSYSEQRAVRVKRVVDRKRIARLEPDSKKSRQTMPASTPSPPEDAEDREEQASNPEPTRKVPKQFSHLLHNDISDGEETLSPEEIQLFEHENRQLYEDMNSMVDEVKQIEGKVVEISRLQEIFSEKVLDQETDIDRIAGTVVGTTENIKEANEEIREAMKNNAGLRVWILFFLIVCSFSLLFLDWYNA